MLRLQVESYHMYQVEKMCLDILSDMITEVRFQTEFEFTLIYSEGRFIFIRQLLENPHPCPRYE